MEAHRHGILTATTLMANGDAFEDAVRLAKENPTLDIGCHLVMVQGNSVLHPGQELPKDLPALMQALVRREIPVYKELRAQMLRILDAGLQPSHLDTHKHTHLLPPVLEAVSRLAREFGVQWVRRPFDFGIDAKAKWTKRTVALTMRLAKPRFAHWLDGLKTTDHFTGFQLTGTLDGSSLLRTLAALPEGLTEFMCHPGYLGPELRAAKTRLKASREVELRALLSREARELIQSRGIHLVAYRGK